MKKWLYAVGLSLTLTISTIAQSTDKIAVINVLSIFQRSPQCIVVAKQLENELNGYITKLHWSMECDLQTKMQQLQRGGSTMNNSEHNPLVKLVVAQRKTFSTKAQTFEQDNRYRQMKEHNKIPSYIQSAVKSLATKESDNIVIDANVIAYASKAKDITANVLKQVK